jgi:hypothetical protein
MLYLSYVRSHHFSIDVDLFFIVYKQELLAFVDMEGVMESAEESLFVGALLAQTSLF